MIPTKQLVLILCFALIYFLEFKLPFFLDRKERLAHTTRNLSLGIINGIIVAILFSGALSYLVNSDLASKYGLLNQFIAPTWLIWISAILLFDLWMYLWHVLNHKVKFFWRFHKVHHSDTMVDSTSAFRFHTGEIVFSSILRLAVLPVLGLSFPQIIVYEIILLPFVMFHHSNISLPKRLDRLYRLIFVSPNMHRVHHSDQQRETDSNYSSIFSFWDRIFTTYRKRKNYKSIKLGLSGVKEQSFTEILKWPFKR